MAKISRNEEKHQGNIHLKVRREEETSSWNRLPGEVKEKILLGLPQLSVLTIQAVNRECYEIASSARFRKAKDNRTTEKFIVTSSCACGVSIISTMEKRKIVIPRFLLYAETLCSTSLVDAETGLLLFAGIKCHSVIEFVVCNPLTMSYKCIPFKHGVGSVMFEFRAKLFVDPATHSYKIIVAWFSLPDCMICYIYQSTKQSWQASLPQRIPSALGLQFAYHYLKFSRVRDFVIFENKVYYFSSPMLLWCHNLSTENLVPMESVEFDLSVVSDLISMDAVCMLCSCIDDWSGKISQTREGVFFALSYLGHLVVFKFDEAAVTWVALWAAREPWNAGALIEYMFDKEDGNIWVSVISHRDVYSFDITSGELQRHFSIADSCIHLHPQTNMQVIRLGFTLFP